MTRPRPACCARCATPAELEAALKRALGKAIAAGLPSGPVSIPDVSTTGFSSTYTVEAGVDELDVVRYDGTHLFVAPTYTGSGQDRGDIRILRTDTANATATPVGSIPLGNSALGVMGMYVEDGHLLLLTAEAYFGEYGDILDGPHHLGAHETHGPGV